jgi:histidinol-phosphate aminotransferase
MTNTVRLPYLRPEIAALPPVGRLPYAAGYPRPMRALHLNECPLPPSPAVIAAIVAAAPSVNRYPDAHARALADALAQRTGIEADRIVFGTGSEELLNLATLVSLSPGEEIVASVPSFNRYARSAELSGGHPIRVPVLADGRNDIEGLLAAVTPRTRILFCATPNNPTGWYNDASEMTRLVSGLSPDVLLIIDEAYYEFARHAGAPELLPMMAARRGSWIVMRTFSKAYCLAGLRLGYALCSAPEVAAAISRGRNAFNASALAQTAALAALSDTAHLARVLDSCAGERERLIAGCRKLGLSPFPSVTNFVSIATPLKAADIVAAMEQRGILIISWSEGGRDDVIRISIGLPEDTDAVLSALEEILAAAR